MEAVRLRLNDASTRGRVVTSELVVAELMYGVECSTGGAARHFGRVKADLRRRGVVKGDVDLLLAATALDLDAALVTNDGALLDGTIADLRTENWLAG